MMITLVKVRSVMRMSLSLLMMIMTVIVRKTVLTQTSLDKILCYPKCHRVDASICLAHYNSTAKTPYKEGKRPACFHQ